MEVFCETCEKREAKIRRLMAAEAEAQRISEMERQRFSMDLHDDICQRLAGISMFCKSIISGVSPEVFLPELSDLIDETLARTRQYAHNSFPVGLEFMGLKEALSALCDTVAKQSSCRCDFTWSVPVKNSPFTSAQDLNIYRIVQEALQNAVKHAKAAVIQVEVQERDKNFIVTVKDDGCGDSRLQEKPDTQEKPGTMEHNARAGLGLRSMRYRASQLGAVYSVESSELDGTKVEVKIQIPLEDCFVSSVSIEESQP